MGSNFPPVTELTKLKILQKIFSTYSIINQLKTLIKFVDYDCMNKLANVLLLLLLLSIVFSQCVKESIIHPVEFKETIISGGTKIISDDDWYLYFEPEFSDTSLYVFNSEINSKYKFKENDIIAASVENGMLKKITTIQKNANLLFLYVENSSLTDAVQRGFIKLNTKFSSLGLNSNFQLQKVYDAFRIDQNSGIQIDIKSILYDADGDTGTTNDQLLMQGKLSIDVLINLSLSIENFVLEKLDFEAKVNEEVDLTLNANTQFDLQLEKNIAFIEGEAINIYIDEFPVVITPVMKVSVGVNGSSDGNLSLGTIHNAFYNMGVNYNQTSKWSPFSEIRNIYSNKSPELDSDADVKFYVKIRLMFNFYNVTGSYIEGTLYNQMISTSSLPWQLYLGTNAGIGVGTKIIYPLTKSFDRNDLINYRQKIAQGQ